MTAGRAWRWLPWAVAAAVVVVALVIASGGRSTDDSPAARVEHLSKQLRCPTCQGLAVADSPATTARAIREDVARRVEEGESDAVIKQAYVERYGEWILLRPRSSGVALVAWVLPVAVLVGALGALVLALRRWRSDPDLAATEADEALVAEALEHRSDTP